MATSTTTTTKQAQAGAARTIDSASERAHEYVDRAAAAASGVAHRVDENINALGEKRDELMEMTGDWAEEAREYVRANPFAAVAVAAAAGYLLSVIMRWTR